MAVLGEEVADAYISVHADMRAFRQDMRKLQASSNSMFDELGKEAGSRFQKAWTKEIRGISLQSLSRSVRSGLQRLQRTIATDLRIIGALIQDRLVAPINRGLTRAMNQVIVSVGVAKDAVVDFGRDTASVFGGQIANQFLRVRSMIDSVEPSLRGLKNAFLNTAVGAREMIAPGLWDRFLDEVQLFVVHMGASGRRAVEAFRDGFGRAWNSDLMVAVRAWVRDLVAQIGSGLNLLGSVFNLGFLRARQAAESGGQRITAAFDAMWTRLTARSRKGSKDNREEFEDFTDGVQGALFNLADTTERQTERAGRATTRFIGRLKGNRNDALNTIGAIGGAFEDLISGALTKGFQFLGGIATKLGGKLMDVGEGAGFLQGPLNMIGAAMARAGAAMTVASATGIGLIIVVATLVASFFALGAAVALASTLLSALIGIVVMLTSSLAFAVAGALLPLGVFALAAAAGVGALVVAFKDLDDAQKAAFDPLKATFKDLQKVVRQELFKNLADQIDGLNGILKDSVAPLLVGAAGALSGVIDYMIAAFERPEVKQTLATLAETLPGILSSLGRGFTDLLTGLLGFFDAIAPDVQDVADKLAEMAKKFSDWANSTEGQNTIKDFFTKAKESADILWDVIKNVGTALGTLFEEGKDGGDSMIQKIADIITKFAEWATSDEGRKEIKQWFEDSKTVAGQLFDAISTISTTIKDLDTPENRKALQSLFNGLNSVLGLVDKLSKLFQDLPSLINTVKGIAFSIPGLGAVVSLVDDLVAGIDWITKHLPGARSGTPPGPGGGGGAPQAMRAGGLVTSPRVFAGEAGKEIVVPLVRPLNQVDPSVRAVSAFARGMGAAAANTNAGGKVVNIHEGAVQVTAATDNQDQVANAVLDRLVARWK